MQLQIACFSTPCSINVPYQIKGLIKHQETICLRIYLAELHNSSNTPSARTYYFPWFGFKVN